MNEIATIDPETKDDRPVMDLAMRQLSVAELRGHVDFVQDVSRSVLKEGSDYGEIPGTGDKKNLLKPGAEKIALAFQFAASYDFLRHDMANGHREYEVTCTLTHRLTGMIVGQGVGECSTMESKYRYRSQSTGRPVPSAYWDTRDPQLLGGSQFSPRKKGNKWEIFERIEHDNPADYYNTILKMGKKRAYVDAVITATGSSDLWTQDVEDLQGNGVIDRSNGNRNTSKKEDAPLMPDPRLVDALTSNAGSVDAIKRGLKEYAESSLVDALERAAEAFDEITDEDKRALWSGTPGNGGVFTSAEKQAMQTTEFRLARPSVQEAMAKEQGERNDLDSSYDAAEDAKETGE